MSNMKFGKDKIVMTIDDKEIAYMTIKETENGDIEFIKLFVDPAFRGQGIAGKFMEKAAEEYKEKNIIPICSYAYSWYKKKTEEYKNVHFPENGPACKI